MVYYKVLAEMEKQPLLMPIILTGIALCTFKLVGINPSQAKDEFIKIGLEYN